MPIDPYKGLILLQRFIGRSGFRSCLQGVEGVGKGALVYISLGPQYTTLGTFSAWFFVVFQAVSMVVAVAQSAVSQLSAGR